MTSIPQFSTIFKQGDVFILDRGFRDVVPELRRRGYSAFTPALTAQQGQLTWQQANQTRKVTKVRWVVEAVIGRIKTQFRIFYRIVKNTDIRSKNEELKIVCSLINKYGDRFISDSGYTEEIVDRIMSRMDIENKLVHLIIRNNITQQRTMFSNFDPLTERLIDPPLTMEEFYLLATGSYLLKYIDAYKSASKRSNLQVKVSLECLNIL